MSKKPSPSPLMPDAPLIIKGKTYKLAFTFGSLAVAEEKLKAAGVNANMLAALDFKDIGAQKLAILFFAALQPQHPNITFEQARSIITMSNAAKVYEAVGDAYIKSMAEPDEEETASPQKPE